MVVGPATMTWPSVTSKKRATSATYSRPLLPSQGSLPFSPSCPRWPMAHMARISATPSSLVAMGTSLPADGVLAKIHATRGRPNDSPPAPPPRRPSSPKIEGHWADGARHALLRRARLDGEISRGQEGDPGRRGHMAKIRRTCRVQRRHAVALRARPLAQLGQASGAVAPLRADDRNHRLQLRRAEI